MGWFIEFLKSWVYGIVSAIVECLAVGTDVHKVLLAGFLPFSVSETAADNHLFLEILSAALRLGCGCGILLTLQMKYGIRNAVKEESRYPGIALLCEASLLGALYLLFGRKLRTRLLAPFYVSLITILSGFVLLYASGRRGRQTSVSWQTALKAGVLQALYLLPGTGCLLCALSGSLIAGLKRTAALRFSFLCTACILICSGLFSLFSGIASLSAGMLVLLCTGTAAAFAVSVLVSAAFLRYCKYSSLRLCALYTAAVGILTLAAALLRILPPGVIL
ncbi:MAG: hypothetical protein IKD71_05775 [Solobacterium sp.]|nr:hypothetical protein [Solobacterium sp.]